VGEFDGGRRKIGKAHGGGSLPEGIRAVGRGVFGKPEEPGGGWPTRVASVGTAWAKADAATVGNWRCVKRKPVGWPLVACPRTKRAGANRCR
jgi:hypothetical protein